MFGRSYQVFFDSQMSGMNRPQDDTTDLTRTWPPVATVVMLAARSRPEADRCWLVSQDATGWVVGGCAGLVA